MAWPYLEAGDLFVEKRREDWIREQGFGFLRTTWSETLQEPSELCRRVFGRCSPSPPDRRPAGPAQLHRASF